MQYTISLLAFLLSSSAFGQSAPNYLEVVIQENVELKLQSVTVTLSVETIDFQTSSFLDEHMGLLGDDGLLFEEDGSYFEELNEYELEEMSPSDRKEYEEKYAELLRMKQEENARNAAKIEELTANFKPQTVKDLKQRLKAAGYKAEEIIKDEFYQKDHFLREEEYHGEYSDTVLHVILNSKENGSALVALIKEKPIHIGFRDHSYETIDVPLAENAKKMAERAKKQASSLAASMNKKTGALLSISTVHPGVSLSLITIESTLRDYREKLEYPGTNPFDVGRPAYIEILYRFALLDQ